MITAEKIDASFKICKRIYSRAEFRCVGGVMTPPCSFRFFFYTFEKTGPAGWAGPVIVLSGLGN